MQTRMNASPLARKARVRRGATAKQLEAAERSKSDLRKAVEALGESWERVRRRMRRGATLEQALTGPRRPRLPRCEHCGQAVKL